MKNGDIVELEGYGTMQGQSDLALFLRMENGFIYLGFDPGGNDPIQEVPFRVADGCAKGSVVTGGLVIPSATLSEIKGGGKSAGKAKGKEMRKVIEGEVTEEKKTTAKGPTSAKASTNGKAPETSEKVSTKTKAKSAAKKPDPEPETQPETKKTTAKTGTSKTSGKTSEPEKPASSAKVKTGAKKPAETAPEPPKVKTSTKTKAATATQEDEDEERELSPMEEEAGKVQDAAEGQIKVNLPPVMFRQLEFDEIRPHPNGSRKPGWKEFKKALAGAIHRSYAITILDEAGATFLMAAFERGFTKNWRGSLVGGFKRAARRIAEEINTAFDVEIPEVITEEPEEGPKLPVGRPPTTEEGKRRRAEAEAKAQAEAEAAEKARLRAERDARRAASSGGGKTSSGKVVSGKAGATPPVTKTKIKARK